MNNNQLIESLDYHINKLNEVSVSLWKKAAKSALTGRKAKLAKALDMKNLNKKDILNKASRVGKANTISKLSDSKRSANSVRQAAQKVINDRNNLAKKAGEKLRGGNFGKELSKGNYKAAQKAVSKFNFRDANRASKASNLVK